MVPSDPDLGHLLRRLEGVVEQFQRFGKPPLGSPERGFRSSMRHSGRCGSDRKQHRPARDPDARSESLISPREIVGHALGICVSS